MRNRMVVRGRNGAIAILTLFCLTILFFFLAVVVDLGLMNIAETELHSIADASVLAAAEELGDNEQVRALAKEFAGYNSLNGVPYEMPEEDIQIGIWDHASHTFENTGSGNAVKIIAKAYDCSTTFGGLFGVTSFSREVEVVAATTPRDILFLVDLSGSMNDDTETAWATKSIQDKFSGTEYAGVETDIVQDLYDDFGFGTYPGASEHVGEQLGIAKNKYAYAELTDDDGPLTPSSVPEAYRIYSSDDEETRKARAYAWIIDYQISYLMPNAMPSSASSSNYDYWEKYLDYVIERVWISSAAEPANDDDDGPEAGLGQVHPDDFRSNSGYQNPFRLASQPAGRFFLPSAVTKIASEGPGQPPIDRGWLPPNQGANRIDMLNNPNFKAYPDSDIESLNEHKNKIGYETYLQFMLDMGRDAKPDGMSTTPLSLSNSSCPMHNESINSEIFQFPPRTQPMNSVRRSLISALQIVRERNAIYTNDSIADQVAIMTFDRKSNGTTVMQELTTDYMNAMFACASMQAVGDEDNSTATEGALKAAFEYLKPEEDGGNGRKDSNKIVILVTDGIPNDYDSSDVEIDQFIAAYPDDDYYDDGQYWLDAALIQAKGMQFSNWSIYPIGIGFGTDYDFMDRVARIGGTAVSSEAVQGTGNPALYEQRLREMFQSIVLDVKAGLVQ